ncbi:MAG: FAD-dependent oxidoreductase [Planktomarina sp.]
MKVAIAGAGIGGLSAAALLKDAGYDVQVFDRAADGAGKAPGVIIQPVAQIVLHQMGVRPDVMAAATPVRGVQSFNAKGRKVFDIGYSLKADGAFGLGIDHERLVQILEGAVTQRGIQITQGFTIKDRVENRLVGADGVQSDAFDLVVDAMGAASPLSPLRPRPYRYGLAWGLVNWPTESELPNDMRTQVFDKAHRMAGVMPCGGGQAMIYWSLPETDETQFFAQTPSDWHDQARTLWPAFAPFAQQITQMGQLTFTPQSQGCLKAMWSTGLVHIGDAGHRSALLSGHGENMALLDAAALTWALSHKSGNDALKAYRKARKKHVATYQNASRRMMSFTQSKSVLRPLLRDAVLAPLSRIPPFKSLSIRFIRGDVTLPLRGVRRG